MKNIPKDWNREGWRWCRHGLVVEYMGKRVLLPLPVLVRIVEAHMQAEGLPDGACSVGACYSVGGLLNKVRRGVTRAKVVPKFARKALDGKLARSIAKAGDTMGNVAKTVATHPAFRAGMAAAATAFPVLAPAAVGLEVAARVVKKVEDGKAAALEIKRGVNNAANRKKVKAGVAAKHAIQRTVTRAKAGDQRAQRAAGAIVGARVVSLAARRHQNNFMGR